MKKLITFAALILLLTGCSAPKSYTSQLTDGDKVVASVGNAKITKQGIYEYLMDESGVDYVLNQALTYIASTKDIDQEAVDNEVAMTEATWRAFLGDQIDEYTKVYFGYETFEQYKTEVLIPSVKQIMMIKQYTVDHYDELAEKYMFIKCRIIIVNDESTAMTVISAISNNELTFEEACEQYSVDATNKANKGEIALVSDLTSCTADKGITTILPQLTKKGLYATPIALSSGKYAVLEVVETDKTVLKDLIMAQLQDAEEVIYEAESFYLNEANFTIKDKYFESKMKSQYPSYFE